MLLIFLEFLFGVYRKHDNYMYPLLKWAGGKRKLTEAIVAHTGQEYNRYFEPFLGGGAMLLYLAPKQAICSDVNEELINFYNVVKNNVEELIHEIAINYVPNHSSDFFYARRNLDRNMDIFAVMTNVERAARFLYLNKTCYNGLWRVNRQGYNNVPCGNYVNLNILDETNLHDVHNYFLDNDIQINHADYSETVQLANEGDLVYFDPPYDDENKNSFVDYSVNGFTRNNQVELRDVCNELVDRGVKVAISNANTAFMRELYSNERYQLFDDIQARRNIGATAAHRHQVNELLIVSNN